MRIQLRRWCLGLLPVVAACGITDVDTQLPIWEEEGDPFVETLDAAAIESVVQSGDAEFELVLLDDGVTVGELAVRTEGDPRSDMIQSRIEALEDSNGGRVRLALGEIEVSMSPETRYWIEDEQVDRETFVGRVRLDLAAGRKAPVIAERNGSMETYRPDDGFVADDLTLGGDGLPALRMRAGRDHVERVASPTTAAPDAWLRLVGCRWGLRTRDGTTSAERHRHGYFRMVRFDGDVSEIDVDRRLMVLEGGETVQLARRTWIKYKRRAGYARSLSAAAAAMEEGHGIDARGLGVVINRQGLLLALKVALKIEEAEPETRVAREFEGVVFSARPGEAGTVMTLADGSTVELRSDTELVAADEFSPNTVDGLMEALGAGREVVANGAGWVMTTEPLALEGTRVVLRAEPEAPPLDFVDGTADYVDGNGSVILVDGMMVMVTGETEITAADANSPASIAELIAMLDQNRRVRVTTEGRLNGPQQISAVNLVLTAMVETLAMEVIAVDPYGPGVILENDSFVLVPEGIDILLDGAAAELWEVDGALMSGQRVQVTGTGYLTGRPSPPEPDSYEAIRLEFETIG